MQNQDKGIVMSTQSLVLQKVGRMSRGEYECQAVNSEGTTTSNPVNLNIMCKNNSIFVERENVSKKKGGGE